MSAPEAERFADAVAMAMVMSPATIFFCMPYTESLFAGLRACVCVRAYACVRACVTVWVCARAFCVCVCVCVCVYYVCHIRGVVVKGPVVCVCMCMCVCVCVCVCGVWRWCVCVVFVLVGTKEYAD